VHAVKNPNDRLNSACSNITDLISFGAWIVASLIVSLRYLISPLLLTTVSAWERILPTLIILTSAALKQKLLSTTVD